jgi:hypothetical protein
MSANATFITLRKLGADAQTLSMRRAVLFVDPRATMRYW